MNTPWTSPSGDTFDSNSVTKTASMETIKQPTTLKRSTNTYINKKVKIEPSGQVAEKEPVIEYVAQTPSCPIKKRDGEKSYRPVTPKKNFYKRSNYPIQKNTYYNTTAYSPSRSPTLRLSITTNQSSLSLIMSPKY